MSDSTDPQDAVRWNIKISKDTDIAVRSFLARAGFKKGDLSKFVEEAVRWRVFDQTLGEIRPGFVDLNSKQLQDLVDEAVGAARAQLLKEGLFDAFRPNKKAPRRR
ncbi:MAG TPA: ribbon-helix-helix domain-containing protein [Burkholderiales bacterium]|nr:ribbon-helix-helix domain-containing protein [Burkholderiales bacterium]